MIQLVLRCCAVLTLALGCLADSRAAQFVFGQNANGLTGQSSPTSVTDSGVTLSVASNVAGATFNETGKGLGLDSRLATPNNLVETSNFGGADRLNLQELVGDLAQFGESTTFFGESLSFSFDRAGTINELYFDGVKDESFEFFRLETPNGQVYSFFDAEIGLRISDVALIDEPNLTLLNAAVISNDDDVRGLSIPFAAGDAFRLVYGEFIVPSDLLRPTARQTAGNGARWEGVGVTTVPEPSSIAIVVVATFVFAGRIAVNRR